MKTVSVWMIPHLATFLWVIGSSAVRGAAAMGGVRGAFTANAKTDALAFDFSSSGSAKEADEKPIIITGEVHRDLRVDDAIGSAEADLAPTGTVYTWMQNHDARGHRRDNQQEASTSSVYPEGYAGTIYTWMDREARDRRPDNRQARTGCATYPEGYTGTVYTWMQHEARGCN